jgi:hypothetical protein
VVPVFGSPGSSTSFITMLGPHLMDPFELRGCRRCSSAQVVFCSTIRNSWEGRRVLVGFNYYCLL